MGRRLVAAGLRVEEPHAPNEHSAHPPPRLTTAAMAQQVHADGDARASAKRWRGPPGRAEGFVVAFLCKHECGAGELADGVGLGDGRMQAVPGGELCVYCAGGVCAGASAMPSRIGSRGRQTDIRLDSVFDRVDLRRERETAQLQRCCPCGDRR